MENILDKVIQSHEEQIKNNLNSEDLVTFLLQDLNNRERDIIKARYGLDRAKKETLESIGKKLEITRERVRQIENSALRKAKAAKGIDDKLSSLISFITKNISEYGNLRHEDSLMAELLENSSSEEIDKNRLLFIFNNFLSDYIAPVDIVHTEPAWALIKKDTSYFQAIINEIKSILAEHNQPLVVKHIINKLKTRQIQEDLEKLINEMENLDQALCSCMEVSLYFKKNLFDKWGLSHWRLVNPKRMRDKIYLVLSKDSEPLHYKRIADRINEEKFDHKRAHPATIHNELILDDRFVLIGRGIYALAEWGYKPGIIAEVVKEVLAEAGQPLSRDQIAEEVLKRRMVKEGSINLALMDESLFHKTEDGRYTLK